MTALERLDQPESVAIETIELPLLLKAIYQRYGYDLRDYAVASLMRRIRRAMTLEKLATLSAFQERVLREAACMARFLDVLSVDVSAMFRDPGVYQVFRDKVVPGLRGLPLVRVWHAGCCTGEEVYSMAILLHEAGLLGKTKLYATDINERVLAKGRGAIFPLKRMREYTGNYQHSGGLAQFSDYYAAKHEGAIMRDFLRGNIVWATHNLVTDSSFNEFHVILCRNVMIYFNRELQARVHKLLYQSLAPGGVLWLGAGESLRFTPFEDRYDVVDEAGKLYRKAS
ncbi:protein-glutamate O-methyltransferase CheR [Ramlibacter sp. 2FC]|uniref:CheR family methyltransferase n=1 Tax=Ramlibacter sp. 2FC TaxID=2502188 RepID=UPI0010F7319F|nr:protein-glutamate O-methyltransferase CheR [Ramlibacter sp. 2FC]